MPQSDALHLQNLMHARDDAARAAYLYLVRMAERIPGYRCYPNPAEGSHDFQYHDVSGHPFSLKVETDSLHFAFRKPDVKAYSCPAALAGELEENEAGEVIIHIRDIEKATQVMAEIFNLRDQSHLRSAA